MVAKKRFNQLKSKYMSSKTQNVFHFLLVRY